jgi:hypothetical protein
MRTSSALAPPQEKIDVKYVDKLQRQNAEDLAFYPMETLRKAMDSNHIIHIKENGDPAGYLWFGALWPQDDTIIYQACIDYDLRRQHLGFSMLSDLIIIVKSIGGTGIRLKCGSSSESNSFWKAAGFYCTAVVQGGVKRKRDLNVWRTDFDPSNRGIEIIPSSKPVDLREYNKAKMAGLEMPSRFSRRHYGKVEA